MTVERILEIKSELQKLSVLEDVLVYEEYDRRYNAIFKNEEEESMYFILMYAFTLDEMPESFVILRRH